VLFFHEALVDDDKSILGSIKHSFCIIFFWNRKNRFLDLKIAIVIQKCERVRSSEWVIHFWFGHSVTNCMQFFFKFQSKIAQIALEISILDTIFQAILLVNLPYWSNFPIYLPYWAKAIFVLKKISKSCNLRHWPIFLMVHLIYTTQSYRTDRS